MRRALAVALAGALVVLGACGGGESAETFDDDAYPFTFEYDGEAFDETSPTEFDSVIGSNQPEDTTALALDEDNGIILQHFVLEDAVDGSTLEAIKEFFDEELSQVAGETPEGVAGETIGLPSIEYTGVPTRSPVNGESRLLLLFDGSDEYVINCQSTPQHLDEIEAACDQIQSTLEAR